MLFMEMETRFESLHRPTKSKSVVPGRDVGCHRKIRGINFIRVRGTSVERARDHGTLLKAEIRKGALAVLAKKNEWVIRRSPGIAQIKSIQDVAVAVYYNLLMPWLDRQSDRESMEMIRGMSEASGVPLNICRDSLFQPDGLMLLSKLSMYRHLLPEYPPGAAMGCSSAVVAGEWTRKGRLLACRNLDYPIVGPWEANATVVFEEPTEKNRIPVVAVTTAGIHTAGLTAMNREGLTLFTHAHFGRRVSLRGQPVVVIGSELISRAKSIGEAVDLARRSRVLGNWAFVVASARENDAVVIEMSPGKVTVQDSDDGFISHTNYFQTTEMQAEEGLLSGAYSEDLQSRLCRMRQILEPQRRNLEPEHMVTVLGDHADCETGQERVFGNTLSVVTTVNSAVFEPAAQRLWVSCRGESPTGLGDFIEIDVEKFWSKKADGSELRTLPGCRPKNPALTEAVRHYRDAYRAWHVDNHDDEHAERTLKALRKALKAFPEDGHLWMQMGIVSFKQQLFQEARSSFEQAGARKLSAHLQTVRNLYLGRCLDLLGEREKAREFYGTHTEAREPKLRKALLAGLRRPFRASEVGSIMVDLQFPDTFTY